MTASSAPAAARDHDIAVVGLACRFPGARNVEEFWRSLRDGVEAVTFFSDDELRAAGVDPALLARPDYVKAGAVLADADRHDAAFFGHTPREAELLDPQQRVFLECAWTALEHAGYDPAALPGAVGVFAGAGLGTYLLRQIAPNAAVVESAGGYAVMLANDKDFLASRVAYKLNLRGPALGVQTACSTSLVAVHLAVQSLLAGECDAALAGGVSIKFPQVAGYLHQEGMILSPDGHCRPFDARAAGTVGGSGVGVVVLKRHADALAAGDTIHALIRGSAVNNDGAGKVGYTAPSVEGQEAVIAEALAVAGVPAGSIGYVEAHGTGTTLGDPIEVAALTRAFRRDTDRRQFCALGSVKSNCGHLDAAAGVAGLIKAVLALRQREIPPTLHFTTPHPQIDFAAGPFRVAATLTPWSATAEPRRAGVSSFGIGGTNVHVVLEEAPVAAAPVSAASPELFVVSARTEAALSEATDNLAGFLRASPDLPLADVAWTLAAGRKAFPFRRWVVADSAAAAAAALEARGSAAMAAGEAKVAFLFPGQGAQFVGMAAGWYDRAPVFRAELTRCAELLRPDLGGVDLRDVIFAAPGAESEARLTRTGLAQPALFAVAYALARQWMAWGVQPAAMLGHSIGEWVAACLAEVFTLPEALRLVAARGRLMEAQPAGAMLAVALPEAGVRPLLGAGLSVAVVNAPEQTVIAGPEPAVLELARKLEARGIGATRLATSHAFHSAMMEPAAQAWRDAFRGVPRREPKLRWISNLTGDWITAGAAGDPEYWVSHLRQTVRFADGLKTLLAEPGLVLLEVGPGRTLAGLTARHPAWTTERIAVSSLGSAREGKPAAAQLLEAAGRLWAAGVALKWEAFYAGRPDRRRIPLPTYPFQRERFWIESTGAAVAAPVRRELADWFYLPSWKRALPPVPPRAPVAEDWLIIADRHGLAGKLAKRVQGMGGQVTVVPAAEAAERLAAGAALPRRIVSLRDLTDPDDAAGIAGFNALADTARVLERATGTQQVALTVVANGLQVFAGEQAWQPGKALLQGPVRVLPREAPTVSARLVDVVWPTTDEAALLDALVAEASGGDEPFVALRGRDRWVHALEAVRVNAPAPTRLREKGTYLITGGCGGLGLVLAQELARRVKARLVLVGRSAEPGPDARAVIAACERAGAEVMVEAADVSDEAAMRRVLTAVRARFGEIHGVIHAAGVAGGGMMVRRTAAEAAAVLAPKVAGTLVLDRLLREVPLDFFVVMSSLTAQLGEFGQADYAAANAFLDAFAQARRAQGAPVCSIAWDAWREAGMAARLGALPGLAAGNEERQARQIGDAEGAEIFHRALGVAVPHLIISTVEPVARAAELAQPGPTTVAPAPRRHSRPANAQPPVPAVTDRERLLVGLWEELLGVSPVGVQDNFFELGGHSLLATQILARLREKGGAGLTLPLFFEQPTIAGLAAALAAGNEAPADELPPLRPLPRDRALELSFQQQALWLLDRMEGASAHMNELGATSIRGPVDVGRLTDALNAVVRRHEVLRTRFVARADGPVQEILPEVGVGLAVTDFTRAEGPTDHLVRERATALVAAPFDLTQAPLLRAELVRLGPVHHVLLVVVHHIVFDGWSAGLFFREVLAHYAAGPGRVAPELPALPVQYADFAGWQRASLAGRRGERLAGWWRDRLAAPLPVLALPGDRPRPARQTFRGAKHGVKVDAELVRKLEAIGRNEGASLFMTILAAYAVLLGRYAGQDDLVVGSPSASRGQRELEPLIGLFVNLLPLRLDLRGNPRFTELVARVRHTVVAAYAHDALPFAQVVEAVQPPRDPSRHPLFQTILIFQNAAPALPTIAGVTVEPLEFPEGPARSDLDLYLWEEPAGLQGYFIFNTDLFDAATIARLAQRWQTVLVSIAAGPAQTVSELRFESAAALPALSRPVRRVAATPTA